MRRLLLLLPAFLYVRLVRHHGERFATNVGILASDGWDVLIRITGEIQSC